MLFVRDGLKTSTLSLNTPKSYLLCGLVAQSVECRLGMAEAPGSNPGQSTPHNSF